MSVGYVGTQATRLRSSLGQINNLNPKFFSMGNTLGLDISTQPALSPFTGFSGTIGQALRPFPQYGGIDTDCCLENLVQSTYHTLLTKSEHLFHNGLNLLPTNTASK